MSPILLLAIIPPLAWATVNHLDKYSVERYMQGRNPAALVVFTGITSFLMAGLMLVFGLWGSVPLGAGIAIILAGMLIPFSYVPYVYALKRDEASNVAPLFQIVTPLVYVLGIVFLGEWISLHEILAGSCILAGAFVLSFDLASAKIRWRSFLLMTLASLMIAGNIIIFKIFALQTSFWTTSFYDMLGTGIGGCLLLCVTTYRRDFIAVVRQYRHRIVSLNVFIEALNIAARILYGFITLTVPVVIVQFVNGFQPLFILLIGIMLTKWAPRFGIEAIDSRSLVRKFSAILLMVTGLILLSVYG